MFDRTPPRPHPAVRVAITTMTARDVTLETFDAWDNLRQYDVIGEDGTGGCQHILRGGRIKLKSGPRVAEGRSQIVEEYLRNDLLKGVEWLACIDADMEFDEDAICQLLGHAYDGDADADPFDPACPIIGGLCFAGNYDRMYPTLYRSEVHKATGQVVPEPVDDYPPDALVKVAATGAAFVLIHRKVLLHMTKDWPEGFGTDPHGNKNPHPWFVEGQNAGVQFGEDVAFCLRAGALGYPTFVHTGVRVNHIKTFALNERTWTDQRERVAARKTAQEKRIKAMQTLVLPEPAKVGR